MSRRPKKPSLDARVVQLAASITSHPTIKDKSPEGVASRVARRLNAEGYTTGTSRPFFTGPQVLEAFLQAQPQLEAEARKAVG